MKSFNTQKWKSFASIDLFDSVTMAKSTDLNTLELKKGGFNYIGRTRDNNGITAKIDIDSADEDKLNKGNCLTVVMVGDSTCSVFYQSEDFYASQNMLILRSKYINKYVGMFLKNIISQEKYRFSYGRTLTKGYFEKMKLSVPVENNQPDWSFMEDYIKVIYKKYNKISSNPATKDVIELNVKGWKKFNLEDLFLITGSKTTPLQDLEEYGFGRYPFVTTQATNNGVEGFYSYYTEKGNILAIDSAVLGYCSYQPFDFSASDHVEKLIPKFNMNKYVALFLKTILNKEQYRYNYGRKASQARLKERSIKLPSKDGIPDWNLMDNYIKSLSYSSGL